MTDQSIFASCATFCGLVCFSALEPWCNMKRYGCDCCSCGGQRGFCGSCFDRGFNEDSWDRQEEQRQADSARLADPASTEPASTEPTNTTNDNPEGQPQTDAEKVIQNEQPEAVPEMRLSNPT